LARDGPGKLGRPATRGPGADQPDRAIRHRLIWAPRPEVIREVLAAKESARLSTLAGSTDAVLDDLDAVLAQAQNLDLDIAGHPDACAFAAEGIAAARDGHFNAAQSLAACGLGPILHETWGFRLLGEAFKEFRAQSVDDVGMQLMKLTLLQSCTATALIDTEDANPNGFNRHATQHGNREFFSRANALAGVLLLVGWLREFKWLADNHPRLFRADNDGDNDAQGESGQERK
jgi:hypothetical protein